MFNSQKYNSLKVFGLTSLLFISEVALAATEKGAAKTANSLTDTIFSLANLVFAGFWFAGIVLAGLGLIDLIKRNNQEGPVKAIFKILVGIVLIFLAQFIGSNADTVVDTEGDASNKIKFSKGQSWTK